MQQTSGKIGIITFVRSENYGAVLQSYALKASLAKMGADAEIVNYPIKYSKLPFPKRIIHMVWDLIRSFLGAAKKRRKITAFIKNKMGVRDDFFDPQNLLVIRKYMKWIVGSDQVWNLKITDDPAFRLEFVIPNQQKYSYAASFGKNCLDLSEELLFRRSLRDFKLISVREESGIEILRRIGYDAISVLDPTLLLTSSDWQNHLNLANTGQCKDYALCYLLTGNPLNRYIISRAYNYTSKNGIDLYVIGARETSILRFWDKVKYINTAGPEEFVELVLNAKIVFTNSFHGTCFSLIFQKQFITFLKGGAERNNRITELLEKLSLSHRIIEGFNDYSEFSNISPINYSIVSPILEQLRQKSLNYLNSIVQN